VLAYADNPRTTGRDSSVLIIDELEYEPFTENRQWPSGELKIARCETPAMPRNRENSVIRAGICARRCGVCSALRDKLLMLLSDLDRPGRGESRRKTLQPQQRSWSEISDIQVLLDAFPINLSANSYFLERKWRVTPAKIHASAAPM
jgi:hypothetical protein